MFLNLLIKLKRFTHYIFIIIMSKLISPSEMLYMFKKKSEASSMYRMITKTNHNKNLPSSFGKKWLTEENDKLFFDYMRKRDLTEEKKKWRVIT